MIRVSRWVSGFLTAAALGGAIATVPASAEQFWVSYSGDRLPEADGWERAYGYGGAERTIDNGALTIDSLRDVRIYDFANWTRPGKMNPGPGESFIASWRMRVDVGDEGGDPGFGVMDDAGWIVGFRYSDDLFWSSFEQDVRIPITKGSFHDYRLASSDMRSYELYVDERLVHRGQFWHGVSKSRVAWGDGVEGAVSRSSWDFVEFGVTPEPPTALSSACVVLCLTRGAR